MRILKEQGAEILVTARDKDVTTKILDELEIPYLELSKHEGGGVGALLKELIQRDYALYKVVKEFKPDVMASIGGTFIAHVGFLTRTTSVVFYDTENAKLQNLITYPLASFVVVPDCYEAWVPEKHHIRYPGYHELSYMAEEYFQPSKELAIANGLKDGADNFFIRIVSWDANHDIGEDGWSVKLLTEVTDYLSERGNVILSSEAELPGKLQQYAYQGKTSEIHHLMAFSRLFVGESATMASECAVMGVPSIYAAYTGRGYTNEQEKKYGLVRNLFEFNRENIIQTIDELLSKPVEDWHQLRDQLLNDTVDVARYVVDTLKDPAASHQAYRNRSR